MNERNVSKFINDICRPITGRVFVQFDKIIPDQLFMYYGSINTQERFYKRK